MVVVLRKDVLSGPWPSVPPLNISGCLERLHSVPANGFCALLKNFVVTFPITPLKSACGNNAIGVSI